MAAPAPADPAPMPPKKKIRGKCLDNIASWDESQNMEIGYSHDITELPEFPLNLRKLVINGQYSVSTLPEFPATLEELTLVGFGAGTPIQSMAIPALPASLRKLTLKGNIYDKSVTLPVLPASLRELVLHNRKLNGPLVLNEGLEKLELENTRTVGMAPLDVNEIFGQKPIQISNLPASLTSIKLVQQIVDSVLPLINALPALASVSFTNSHASQTPVLPDTVQRLSLSRFRVTDAADPRMFSMPNSLVMLNMEERDADWVPIDDAIRGFSRVSPVLRDLFAARSRIETINADQFPNTLVNFYVPEAPITQLPNFPEATRNIDLRDCTALPAQVQQLIAQNSSQWFPGFIRAGWGDDPNLNLNRFKAGLRAYNARRLGRDLAAMGAVFGGPPPPPPPGGAELPPALYDPFGEITAAQAAAEAAKPAGQRFKEGAPENVMSKIASFLTGAPGSRTTQRAVLREMVSRPPGAPGAGMGGGRRKTRKNRKARA